MNRILIVNALLVITFLSSPLVSAFQVPSGLKRFVSDDVVGVGFVDLEKVQPTAVAEWFNSLGFTDEVQQRQFLKASKDVQKFINEIKSAGAEDLYFVFRVSDFEQGAPSWIVSVREGGDASKLLSVMKPFIEKVGSSWPVANFEAFDGAVIGSNSVEQLELLKSSKPTDREELVGAWKELGSREAGLIIFGDQDSRRTIRYLLPKFAEPFDKITGALVGDKTKWFGVGLSLPPRAGGTLKLVTANQKTSEIYSKAIEPAIELMKRETKQNDWTDALGALVENMKPSLNGNEIVVDLDSFFSDPRNVANALKPAFDKARSVDRMTKLRNLAIAMHNYESAHKAFPAHAIYSEDGKPLLSWRVSLLPFIGQFEFYKQFNLDEPWDSEHNIKLVKKMPDVFADPDPKFGDLMRAGKTIYQVPYAEGAMFFGKEGATFRKILDGSSNTMLIVQVAGENAVEWTKPADWNVDFDKPSVGLNLDAKQGTAFAIADGSTEVLKSDVADKVLKAVVTRAGGEIVAGDELVK